MDLQKEREAFEAEFKKTDFYKMNLVNCFCFITDRYVWDEVQAAWEMWQAAKAQAVPEWISTSDRMPEEGEEVFVHSLGQVRQVTRDSKWAGGFKERNCYGWQAAYGQSHWMPKSIELPEQYHFYYENDAKQKAMIEAQEQGHG
ncbi:MULTISPECIES: DUF551 domain-containing protein [unclassified Acinetobacter]|uniref:DUF551 domain-containing protein n=1 Tax=unclassified Acinetobacter TaxID=196816 RepID=UPI0021B7847E|nr:MULTISPECIES: DUF551 domain-containing protein [unclassified Acinetobacter]